MATVADAITGALSRIGAWTPDDGPVSSADMESGYNALNVLMDGFSTQRLTIPWVQRITQTITSGVGSYTIGTGATWNTPRPPIINQINYQDTSQSPALEYQLGPLLTPDQYAAIPIKTLTSNLPTDVYYEPWGTSGSAFGTVRFYPVPTSTTLQAVLYVPTSVSAFTNRYADLIVPNGYQRFIELSLAYELCPIFQKTASQDLKDQLETATRDVKRINMRQVVSDLNFDAMTLGGSANYWTRSTFYSGG